MICSCFLQSKVKFLSLRSQEKHSISESVKSVWKYDLLMLLWEVLIFSYPVLEDRRQKVMKEDNRHRRTHEANYC